MQRQALMSLAGALAFGSVGALAQGGDLSGVTMRVLDDLSDIDAVVLELDANRGESEARPESNGGEADDGARQPVAETAADERRSLRRERDELHDIDDDERSEGRIEDRDVQRPAVPPPAVP